MVSDYFAVILFVLSTLELLAALGVHYIAKKPILENSSMITKISSQMETNGLTECRFCHHIVARYFIDSTGKSICANCKPAQFAAAEKDGRLNTR